MPLGADRLRRDAASPSSAAAGGAVGAALGRVGGLAAARLRIAEAGRRLLDAARDDLDGGLAAPLLVVVFALGAALYFLLPREPWAPAVVGVAVAAIGATAVARARGHAARGLATAAALLAGVAAGSLESARVAAPRLDHERTVTVTGRVSDVDATQRGGARLTVDVVGMEAKGLSAAATPTRVSATVTRPGGVTPRVGDGVRFKARLKPPEGPVLPGGYDFARRAWFEGRGASGYVLGRVEVVDLGAEGAVDRALAAIGRLRHAIADRVRATLPGATGAIGAALMVGEQRAIPEVAAEPLRASGLTHIVSISGLHMSLVGGGVIVAVRLALVLFPALALRISAKKWAAAAALVAITVYLLLSGAQVAALRSHLMLSIALVAVMVDRPAITLHTIAVSALLILAWDPSAVMEPSFLMSYLAVIALVGGYDLWRRWREARPAPKRDLGPIAQALAAGLAHVEGLAVSSLIAGLATAPVIAAVFHRGAPYSILANMLVLPVTGLLIMPAAVVAALAMPFGLDPWPLAAMGFGIDVMVAVGRWASALPGGGGLIGAPHAAMMPLGIAAVVWAALWPSRIRLAAVVPAGLAVALAFAGPRPDVIIGRHGTAVAVRGDDGRLHVTAPAAEKFDVGIWLASDADGRAPTAEGLADGWRCDRLGCVFRRAAAGAGAGARDGERDAGGAAGAAATGSVVAGEGSAGAAVGAAAARDGAAVLVAVVRDPRAFAEDCRRAALVVTTLVAPAGCAERATVFDRVRLAETGAVTLTVAERVAAVPGHIGAPGDGATDDGGAGGVVTEDGAVLAPGGEGPGDPTVESVGSGGDAAGSGTEPRRAESRSMTTDTVAVLADGAASGGEGLSEERDDPVWDDERPPARHVFEVTASLPRFPRPWTPRRAPAGGE